MLYCSKRGVNKLIFNDFDPKSQHLQKRIGGIGDIVVLDVR